MKNTRSRRILCTVLIAFLVAFIWGNSLLPAEISAKLSGALRDLLSRWFPGASDISPAKNEGVLRKLAHFSEYCALGICLTWLMGMLDRHPLLPLCCGIPVAWVDETIQLFVPGRSGELRDVCIDSLGVLLGLILVYGIHKLIVVRHRGDH